MNIMHGKRWDRKIKIKTDKYHMKNWQMKTDTTEERMLCQECCSFSSVTYYKRESLLFLEDCYSVSLTVKYTIYV